jgi:hypothetical protein
MLRNYTAYFVVECQGIDTDTYTDAGFYPAATFAEAMAHIEEFYGDELCKVQHLELMDTSLVHMNPELAKQVIAENFY